MRWFAFFYRREKDLPLGKRGELAAKRYLKKLGYKIIAEGKRYRRGEIDIIAVDGQAIVFVEVKTRSRHDEDSPASAVDATKQQRLIRSALIFCKQNRLLNYNVRFDVIAILWEPGSKAPEIEHYQDAFELPATESW